MGSGSGNIGFFDSLAASIKSHFKQYRLLYLSFLVFAVPFFITRLPYFLYYPVTSFDTDYLHYYMIVDQMDKGLFPTFIIRTPGYPLFLKLVFTLVNRNMAVVVVQNILSLIVCLFFIYVIYKVYGQRFKFLPLLTAVGLAAFVSSSIHLLSDITLLTESLFVNFLILSFALFIFAIHLKNSLAWVLCSVSTAGTILIRPTSIFLILIYLIILAFLLVNSHKKGEILCFSLPFIAVLFLLSVYNYLTVGHFTFSGLYSEHALISFTSTFLQEKPTYPPQVNEVIKKCYRRIGAKHKRVLEEDSWDHKKLNRVLRRYYNRNRNFIFESLSAGENKDDYALYLKWRPMLGDMAWTAIRMKPGLYLKYVYSNLLFYFFHNWRDFDFYERLAGMYGKSLRQNRTYQKMFSDKDSSGWGLRLYYKKDYGDTISPRFSESFLKELSHPQPLAGFKKVVKEGEKQFVVKPTLLQRVHTIYKKIHDLLFRNILWTFIFLFQLIFSFFKLLKSRFHHKGALIMFVMTLSALGHGFIICMSSFAILRYSYTLEFVYYLSLFLLPIVTRREKI